MARRSEHSLEEIKEMVLVAAEAIVIEEGFGALKVRKIALEIGYTVGSLYMVFENLDDLTMQVKARTLDDIAAHLDKVADNNGVELCIIKLAQAYLAYASNNFNRWSMVFEYSFPTETAVPYWYQDKVDGLFSRIESLFEQIMPEKTAAEIKQAARALWSGVHGICLLSLSGKSELVGFESVEDSVVLLVQNFMRGWMMPVDL